MKEVLGKTGTTKLKELKEKKNYSIL